MKKVLQQTMHFLRSSGNAVVRHPRSAGVILIGCTALSQLLANIPGLGAHYIAFWQKGLFYRFSAFAQLPLTPIDFINDFLMAFFFLGVATEIKREMMEGELATIRKALMPLFAALGGMVCPALIFTVFNGQTPFGQGWGIPMATDIAFSLGVLSLLD